MSREPGRRPLADAKSGDLYRSRHASGPAAVERFAPADFLALALQHVPEPRLHQVRNTATTPCGEGAARGRAAHCRG